jgi:hypothetical protein
MSKTKGDRLYNELLREERKKKKRVDHGEELKEKSIKNALRSNNLNDLLSFNDYIK